MKASGACNRWGSRVATWTGGAATPGEAVVAYRRVADSLPMPGVFALSQAVPVAAAIEEVITLAECSVAGEWEGQVRHLPL